MKLDQIFEKKQVTTSPKTDVLGSGTEATVYRTKTPGTVVKVVRSVTDPEKNSYIAFIRKIKDASNPFFPKVYKETLRKLQNGKYEYVVTLEKLHPIFKSDSKYIKKIEHIIPVIFKQAGIPIEEFYKDPNLIKNIKDTGFYSSAKFDWAKLRSIFNDPTKISQIVSKSKNPKFKETMDILSPLFRQYGSDLHDDNFMFRLTGHGPQLVLIDPLYPTH